jgi:hypothetical protein
MMLVVGCNQAVSLTNRSSTAWKSLRGARLRGTRTKMPFVFPIRGQAAQDGVGPLGATEGQPR